jgi:hypothetical protein
MALTSQIYNLLNSDMSNQQSTVTVTVTVASLTPVLDGRIIVAPKV